MPAVQEPVWSLAAPSAERIARFLAEQTGAAFSYPAVGESMDGCPPGYNLDHNRVQIGRGARAFAAGCAALRAWKMFPSAWTRISPGEAPIAVGTTVAMQALALGVWWMNACRIVYVLDDFRPTARFGFAYGTLPAHVEEGEERFLVEMLADETVWYDLRAFSRPRFWPVRLAKPVARALQRRFVRDSKAAMIRAVAEARR